MRGRRKAGSFQGATRPTKDDHFNGFVHSFCQIYWVLTVYLAAPGAGVPFAKKDGPIPAIVEHKIWWGLEENHFLELLCQGVMYTPPTLLFSVPFSDFLANAQSCATVTTGQF